MQYDQAQEQSPAILPRHTQAHGGRVTQSMARAQPCPHTTRCRPSRAAPLTRHSPIHIKAPSAGRTHGSTARHGVQTEGVPQTPSPTPHTAEDAAAPHPDLKGLDMGRPRGRREAAHLRAGPPPPCCPHRGSAVRGRPQLWEQRAVGRAPAKVGQSREARPGLASPHRQHWGTAGPRRPRTKAAVGPRRCEGEGEKGCGGGGGRTRNGLLRTLRVSGEGGAAGPQSPTRGGGLRGSGGGQRGTPRPAVLPPLRTCPMCSQSSSSSGAHPRHVTAPRAAPSSSPPRAREAAPPPRDTTPRARPPAPRSPPPPSPPPRLLAPWPRLAPHTPPARAHQPSLPPTPRTTWAGRGSPAPSPSRGRGSASPLAGRGRLGPPTGAEGRGVVGSAPRGSLAIWLGLSWPVCLK